MLGKTNAPLESEEQSEIFRWAEKYPLLEFLQGSLNGVRLTIGQAVKAKKHGLKKGWPDIFLPVKSPPDKSGLFIELKRKSGGVVSEEQSATHIFLRGQGFEVCVCYGSEKAKEVIINYLCGVDSKKKEQ